MDGHEKLSEYQHLFGVADVKYETSQNSLSVGLISCLGPLDYEAGFHSSRSEVQWEPFHHDVQRKMWRLSKLQLN
jgi:hypothetical protein